MENRGSSDKVADGINKPEELIQTILDKKAPTYHHSGAAAQEDSAEGESVGRQIYKHLMNGVSHMLPFVIGGGILIALAFLVDNQAINPANFGKNTPLAALLKTIGEQAFGFASNLSWIYCNEYCRPTRISDRFRWWSISKWWLYIC